MGALASGRGFVFVQVGFQQPDHQLGEGDVSVEAVTLGAVVEGGRQKHGEFFEFPCLGGSWRTREGDVHLREEGGSASSQKML